MHEALGSISGIKIKKKKKGMKREIQQLFYWYHLTRKPYIVRFTKSKTTNIKW
jgi:hypothetical protein